MNSRTALNVGLIAAIVALGAALYFKQRYDAREVQEPFAIVPEQPENLQRIEIQRGHENAIVLERDTRHWRMTSPHQARLDEVQLSRVLDVARLRTSTRLQTDDLARYALDKPWAQIRFNQHAVDFGATNPITQELYLRSGAHVYAVQPRFTAAVPGNAAKLIAHRLFAVDEHPIAFQMKDFSVRHDGVRWQLYPDDPGLSQDDLVRWVDQWRLASSVVTQPASDLKPAESITVELRNRGTVVLKILARAPDLVLLRSDELLQYHLPATLASTLLTAPNAPGAKNH
jgi:hypothetical protein